MRRVRKTYDGPLALAVDYMVFNVSSDEIRVRMSAVDEEIWPSPPMKKKNPPDISKSVPISDFTKSGALGFPEVVQPIYDEINELYDTDYEPVFKQPRSQGRLYWPVIRNHMATSMAATISARATVPTMSSMRFRRDGSSSEPGMVGSCVAASAGSGAGGGIGRRRLGSGSAGAGLITSLHRSWRARGLGTT